MVAFCGCAQQTTWQITLCVHVDCIDTLNIYKIVTISFAWYTMFCIFLEIYSNQLSSKTSKYLAQIVDFALPLADNSNILLLFTQLHNKFGVCTAEVKLLYVELFHRAWAWQCMSLRANRRTYSTHPSNRFGVRWLCISKGYVS